MNIRTFGLSQVVWVAVWVLVGWPLTSTADMVWDELIQGDLSKDVNSPTVLYPTIITDNSIVNASIGGSADPTVGDGYDAFMFIVAIPERLTEFRFDTYEGIGSSHLEIYLFQDLILTATVSSADIGRNFVNDISISVPLSGFFTVQISEFDAVDQPYSLTYVVIPEPSYETVMLFFLGLVSINAIRQRK